MTKATEEKGKEADAEKVTAWSWVAPSAFRCPRCGTITLTREPGVRCPTCGYREGT